MKRICLLFFFLPLLAQAQLKEFDIKEREKPNTATVQANSDYPDNALVFVYSSLQGLNFRSSMSGINKQSYNQSLNRYEILLNPVKQILSVNATGYIAGDIATISPSPKEIFYYSVEQKVSEILMGKTMLTVNSSPSDAGISINDLETNYRTPFDREINSGLTKITLSKQKYLDFDTLLNLIPDRKMNFNINMVPQWIDLSVTVKPGNANIVLDNTSVGAGKVEFRGIERGLNPGIYNLRVDLINHRPFTQRLELKSGQVENLNIELQPILGRVTVNTDTERVEVYLNGNSMGITPFDKEIIIGDYNLLLKKQGFRDENRNFKLSEGANQQFTVEMMNYSEFLNPLKTKALVSYMLGIAGIGSGAYLMQSAEKNYKAYQTATTEAEALRKKVEFADRMSPVGFAVGGIGLLGGIIYSSKIKKYKKEWDLAVMPTRSGGLLSFTHNF